jgi:cyclophilin family peptidyl-prolyl cis-trans isomerase
MKYQATVNTTLSFAEQTHNSNNASTGKWIALFFCVAWLSGVCASSLVFAQKSSAKKSGSKQSVSATANTASSKSSYRPKYVIAVAQSGRPIGNIVIELFPDVAPKHVANFDSLVRVKLFDSTAFHRVIPGFMIQGGDPASKPSSGISKSLWGGGIPGQRTVPAEFNSISHKRGIISAARTNDPNSATSQFFICHGDPTFLDGKYTVFGQVVSGMDVVDSICKVPLEMSSSGEQASPKETIRMTIIPKLQYVISATHAGKSLGNIVIETLPELAPKHVANFDSLVAVSFYDSTAFHRVIGGFMIQGGDPASKPSSGRSKNLWGGGMPGQTTVPAEFSSPSVARHTRGTVSAARTNDPNSATSQFFICHADTPQLDGQYSIWGKVVSGMEVVDAITTVPCEQSPNGEVSAPIQKVEMRIRRKSFLPNAQ